MSKQMFNEPELITSTFRKIPANEPTTPIVYVRPNKPTSSLKKTYNVVETLMFNEETEKEFKTKKFDTNDLVTAFGFGFILMALFTWAIVYNILY